MTYGGSEYFYLTNLQGDVSGLADAAGGTVVSYSYDSWGKLITTTGAMATTLGVKNPYRYRSYRYDNETGLYLSGVRYYSPNLCRWISPEPNVDSGKFDESAGMLAFNIYAYCANNPVIYKDETGESITIALMVGGAILFGAIGGIISHKFTKYYNIPKGQRWKYILGGIVIGGATGVLLGWGGGIAVSAVSVRAAGLSLFGRTISSEGMLISLARQMFESTKKPMNLGQIKQLLTLCKKFGIDITARTVDLTKGHGAWTNIPHIHIGKKHIHIALTKDAVTYIRKIFGV